MPAAIELPDSADPGSVELESHSHSEDADPSPAEDHGEAQNPPAPTLNDEADNSISADELGLGVAGDPLGLATPPPTPAAPLPGFGGASAAGAASGGPPTAAPHTAAPHTAPLARERPPTDPREAYYHQVFDEFVSTKQTCGENTDNFTFDKFAKKLRKNTAQLMQRPGVADVEFTVYIKDGKAALKARVVKG